VAELSDASSGRLELNAELTNKAFSAKVVFANIESILKVFSLIAVLLYAIGLIVTNAYLSQYGITDFSILKPASLMTGIWSLVIIALASIPGAFMLWKATSNETFLRKLWPILVGLPILSIAVSFIACFVFNALTDRREAIPPFIENWSPQHWVNDGWGEILCGLNVVLGFLTVVFLLNESQAPRRSKLLVFSPFLAIGLLGTLVDVGRVIYPKVGPKMGGGHPMSAIIQFNSDGRDVLSLVTELGHLTESDPSLSFDESLKKIPRLIRADLVYRAPEMYVIVVRACQKESFQDEDYKIKERNVVVEHTAIIERKFISTVIPMTNELPPCKN
jgi:hypothetical protein